MSAAMTAGVVGPGPRGVLRRGRYWILWAGLALVFVLLALLLAGRGSTAGVALAPDDATPAGSRALVRVLRAHGVDVRTPTTLAEARADLAGHDATLLVYDPDDRLGAAGLRALEGRAERTLLVEPDRAALRALPSGLERAGRLTDPRRAEAGCSVPSARRAGAIEASGPRYTATEGYLLCFRDDRGAGALAIARDAPVAVLGAPEVLRNDGIAASGNAALALGLLGHDDRLVWFLPSAAAGAPTIAALTPDWVTPVVVLLALVALAAALWRGRRFGPLVAERLPVLAPATEAVEGRARLYARHSARLRALDHLRIGALGRLAARCGLARSAGLEEILETVARLTLADPAALRRLLVDEDPAGDRDLVRLARRLTELEDRVERAVAPSAPGRGESTGPTSGAEGGPADGRRERRP